MLADIMLYTFLRSTHLGDHLRIAMTLRRGSACHPPLFLTLTRLRALKHRGAAELR